MVLEGEGFPGHHLFGDSVCMGSVKQKGRRVAMPPCLYGLRFRSLYLKRPCIHVCLLHNTGSDPGLSQALGTLGRLRCLFGLFLLHGDSTWGHRYTGAQKATQIGRTEGFTHNVVDHKG